MTSALWPETDDTLVPDSLFAPQASAIVPHVEYQHDLIGWAVDKLGIPRHTLVWALNGYDSHEWDGTFEPFVTVARALEDWNDVGIESATTTGKTFFAAVAILWFLACWEGARVFTYAPKEDQLRLLVWMEICKLWERFNRMFPTAEITDLRIRMRGGHDDSWAAHGVAVGVRAGEDVSAKASGVHAKDMLLVYEEMQGHNPAVVLAGENASTAPHNLRLGYGNPDSQHDPLHKFSTLPGVVHVRISALDHPNVVTKNPDLIAGAVSQESIDSRLAIYGPESPRFQSRVRGISPEQSSDSLIQKKWLKASAARWLARVQLSRKRAGRDSEGSENAGLYEALAGRSRQYADTDWPVIDPANVRVIGQRVTGKGVDAANSENGDQAAICDFAGNAVVRLEAFACPDANALGRRVKLEMQGLEPKRVGVDAVGVGAGTANELRRLGANVQALMSGGLPMRMVEKSDDGKEREWTSDVNQFSNLRSQMYWQLREDLRLGRIDVPEDQELWQELTEPKFIDYPKVAVESKDEIKPRLGRSPNKGDALVYANWVREREIVERTREDKYEKTPNVARPMQVDESGHLKPTPKAPKSIDDLVAALSGEKATKTPFRRLVPKRR